MTLVPPYILSDGVGAGVKIFFYGLILLGSLLTLEMTTPRATGVFDKSVAMIRRQAEAAATGEKPGPWGRKTAGNGKGRRSARQK